MSFINTSKNSASIANTSRNANVSFSDISKSTLNSYILQENGSYLLQEDGSKIILEQSVASTMYSNISKS